VIINESFLMIKQSRIVLNNEVKRNSGSTALRRMDNKSKIHEYPALFDCPPA
jgi:hypothetical protein